MQQPHVYPAAPPVPPQVPNQPPPLPVGTIVGKRYLVQGYIGGGGFGHIYKAYDTVLGHRRALKEAFFRDQLTQHQFRLEAEFVLNARHPNLVRGYAVFEEAGRFYLVMDYVDGHTVEELTISHIRATGRVLPEAQILAWIIPVCDALHALHGQPRPIIHRDVKPANIKLTKGGVPVLIDLGLAKLYVQGTNTIGAALAFTPGYAPPEQYQATGATDRRTDVYGLGATLFYLLTGYQPTEAPARLTAQALPAPRALNPALDARTEAAILKAMALDPNERHQTALDLMADLQRARAALADTPAPFVVAAAARPVERLIPCGRCSTGNPQAARFCMRCGAALAAGDTGAFAALKPEASATGEQSPVQPGGLAPAPMEKPAAAPPSVWGWAGGVSRALVARATDPKEALAFLAAVLSLVACSVSLLGFFAGWMIAFVVPGLALACWSWRLQTPETPADTRQFTFAALLLNPGVLAIWLVVPTVVTHLVGR
jgi:Protein kinase domain